MAAFDRQLGPALAILLPGSAWGMPYAPEYGLYAYLFQPLSRSHSQFWYLNCLLTDQRKLGSIAAARTQRQIAAASNTMLPRAAPAGLTRLTKLAGLTRLAGSIGLAGSCGPTRSCGLAGSTALAGPTRLAAAWPVALTGPAGTAAACGAADGPAGPASAAPVAPEANAATATAEPASARVS